MTCGVFLLLSASQLQAQGQTLAQWFYSQPGDTVDLNDLNARTSAAYKEVTQSPTSVQELMARNSFYRYWPEFETRALTMDPSKDLSCIYALASNKQQVYYLEDGVDDYLVSTVFHENFHSDVFFSQAVYSPDFYKHLGFLQESWGFDARAYGSWGILKYFDEAYVSYSDAYVMRQTGFNSYRTYGETYEPGVLILEPLMERIMASGVSFEEIYNLHAQSNIETMLFLLGQAWGEERKLYIDAEAPTTRAEIILLGFEIARDIHQAIFLKAMGQTNTYIQMVSTANTTSPAPVQTAVPNSTALPPPIVVSSVAVEETPYIRPRATCGTSLRFSQAQYDSINSAFTFSRGDFFFSEDTNWYIQEEDYYAVIDAQR